MIGSLTFTRDDGATFAFSATNPPYQLTPDTQLPSGLTLDVSGGEYTGRNGGYTLAGRLRRRTAKIVCNVRETYSDSRSMMQLLNDAAEFFRPMTADLRIVSFDMLVQTDDGSQSAYVMRQGHVTTPFMAPLLRGGRGSYAAEFDLIFDDPLLYWADGSGVVSGDILPAALPGSKIGEVWQDGLQVWAAGLSRWEYPDQGGGGTPQTVHVVSAYQVPVAFTITGQITNPKIVNSRNGSQWSWEGTIPYGCVVTVDVDGVATGWQGNRLLNTMGGLVAAPGDNTFTLTGSDLALDLEASWTGAANASTSILSDAGSVVATQLYTNPNLLTSHLQSFNYTGGSQLAVLEDSDGVLTIQNTDTTPQNTGAQTVGNVQITLPAGSYHLHGEVMTTGDFPAMGADTALTMWRNVNISKDMVPASNVWTTLDADFTMDGVTSLALPYMKTPANSTTWWRHVGLYNAAGWTAMQALGIDWFSGDSMFNVVTAKASVEIRGAF